MTEVARSKNTITKSNALIEASYKLTMNEQRMILTAISGLDPRKPMPTRITLYAKDFAESWKLSENKAYEALESASGRLYERDIKTYTENEKTRKRWVSSVKYHAGEGSVTLAFTREIAPYLTKLITSFTSYKLKHISEIRSVYSIRLFEMLMRFKDTGILIISVANFRDRLSLEDKYVRFTNLKARVIEPAIAELNDISGFKITYRTQKEGRNITQLRFKFKMSEQTSRFFVLA